MNEELRKLAEDRYNQEEFLHTLFDLALAEQWFDIQHLVQHDMAKAILADYSYSTGQGYLNTQVYYDNWEDVIEIGWQSFCLHSGMSREHVRIRLSDLHETI